MIAANSAGAQKQFFDPPSAHASLQGKRVTAVAAAKRHTLARTAEGDVWTWGHCGVSPRRVLLAGARDVQRTSGEEVHYNFSSSAAFT